MIVFVDKISGRTSVQNTSRSLADGCCVDFTGLVLSSEKFRLRDVAVRVALLEQHIRDILSTLEVS